MTFAGRIDAIIRDAGDWVVSQRWYGDKARSIVEVAPEVIRIPLHEPYEA